MCKKELVILRKIAQIDSSFDRDMINCTTFSPAVGGEAPECYQHHPIPGESRYINKRDSIGQCRLVDGLVYRSDGIPVKSIGGIKPEFSRWFQYLYYYTWIEKEVNGTWSTA